MCYLECQSDIFKKIKEFYDLTLFVETLVSWLHRITFPINDQVYFFLFRRTMRENICYLCQEPKSVVGHDTQNCPSVKCKKCGQNGHIHRNCPNLNSKVDVSPKEIKSQNSVVLHDKTKILDFIYEDIGVFDDIKQKLEVTGATLKTKSSGKDQRPNKIDPMICSNNEIMDTIHNIEFSNDIKPKFEVMKEMLNIKSSGINQGLLYR